MRVLRFVAERQIPVFKMNNCLHIASLGRNRDLVAILVGRMKMTIDLWNKDGYSPLHLALKQWDEELAKFFIIKGANPHLETTEMALR